MLQERNPLQVLNYEDCYQHIDGLGPPISVLILVRMDRDSHERNAGKSLQEPVQEQRQVRSIEPEMQEPIQQHELRDEI